jgi:hypothetical protein
MYHCAECSALVVVVDGQIIRVCGHDEAAVIADASAVASGSGGLR